jgi:hypothetical protein
MGGGFGSKIPLELYSFIHVETTGHLAVRICRHLKVIKVIHLLFKESLKAV